MKKLLFGSTVLLSLLGLLFVFEASVAQSVELFGTQYRFLQQQAVWMVVGYIALIVARFVPTKFWLKTSYFWFGLSIILLIAVLIPGIGVELNGAKRWINLAGIFNIQPIEFVKFGLVVFFASWMSKHQRILPFLLMTLLPVILVLLQPDFGSSLILLTIAFGLYYLAGGSMKVISVTGLVGLAALALIVFTSQYRMKRLTTFLNPELDPLGSGFHVRQITLALGRGGVWGQGIGNSRQKLLYIPEASSDSVFAITAEEVGFLGSSFLVFVFAAYLLAGFKLVGKQKTGSFTQLLGAGILIWIGMQTILNIAAVVALIPLTGIPLPFISYGGSSLVMVLFATGILLSLKSK